MFKRNRDFILATFGLLVAAAAMWIWLRPAPPVLSGQYEQATYRKYRPGGPACEPTRLNSPLGRKSESERQRCEEAAEEHRLKSNDLVQQTRAADAAEAIVTLTYSQSRMMLAGAIIGLLTLIAAAFAAWFAQRAARAAEDDLEHSKTVSASQLRPYLMFVNHNDGSTEPDTFRPGEIIRCNLQNFGQTPATNTKVFMGWDTCIRPIGDFEPALDDGGLIGFVAPGAKLPVTMSLDDLDAETFEAVKNGEKVFVLRLRVEYDIPGGGSDSHDTDLFADQRHASEKGSHGTMLTPEERRAS